jgi:hypothetical protein
MAQTIIISLEKEIPELAAYTKSAPGKALAREIEKLDHAARVKKVTAITSLLSENQSALIEQMRAEGMDPTRMRLPPEHFFAASDGLTTLRALHEQVSANLNNFKQPNPILRDLKSAEGLLIAAEKAGVKFHFTKSSS